MISACRNCGGSVSHRDQFCSFCGTPNPAYRELTAQVSQLMSRAMSAYQRRDFTNPVSLFEEVTGLDAYICEAYFYLADSLKRVRRATEALRAMLAAQRIRSGSSAACFNVGLLHKQTGNRPEA